MQFYEQAKWISTVGRSLPAAGPKSKGDLFEVLHYIFQNSSLTITDILSWVIHKRKCSVAIPSRRFVNFERKLRFLFVVL